MNHVMKPKSYYITLVFAGTILHEKFLTQSQKERAIIK